MEEVTLDAADAQTLDADDAADAQNHHDADDPMVNQAWAAMAPAVAFALHHLPQKDALVLVHFFSFFQE